MYEALSLTSTVFLDTYPHHSVQNWKSHQRFGKPREMRRYDSICVCVLNKVKMEVYAISSYVLHHRGSQLFPAFLLNFSVRLIIFENWLTSIHV